MSYLDEEAALVEWLPTAVTPPPGVGVATPADPSGSYSWVQNGFVRLQRVGGGGRFEIDQPRIFVEHFGDGYAAAKTLALKVREAFETRLIGHMPSFGGVILDVRTDSGPSWTPYDDVRVTRFVSTYTLVTHGG